MGWWVGSMVLFQKRQGEGGGGGQIKSNLHSVVLSLLPKDPSSEMSFMNSSDYSMTSS